MPIDISSQEFEEDQLRAKVSDAKTEVGEDTRGGGFSFQEREGKGVKYRRTIMHEVQTYLF
jgi:hypothetical protein